MAEEPRVRLDDPQAQLVQVYIEEYLRSKNCTFEDVCARPKEQVKALMTEACTYAAMKVAEMEARAHTIHQIHGSASSEQQQSGSSGLR